MSISRDLSRTISATQRQRGEEYYRQGRADITDIAGDMVEARVRGTRRYLVVLEIDGDELLCECDCPYFQENVTPCKHVWSSVLAAERLELLASKKQLKRLVPIDSMGEGVQEIGELELDDEPLDGGAGAPRDAKPSPRTATLTPKQPKPARPKREAPPGWMKAVRALQEERAAQRRIQPSLLAPAEIQYVVDTRVSSAGGAMIVEMQHPAVPRRGPPAKPRRVVLRFSETPKLPDPLDRRILAMLQGGTETYGFGRHDPYAMVPNPFKVPADAALLFFREMCGTGRCLVRQGPEAEPSPLRLDEGEAWKFGIELRDATETTAEGAATACAVTGLLHRKEETMSVDQPDAVLVSGLVFTGATLARLDPAGAFPLLAMLRRDKRIVIPRDDVPRFIAEVIAANPELPMRLPPELRLAEVRMPPRPFIAIRRPQRTWGNDWLDADVSFGYEQETIAFGDPRAALFDEKGRRLILRDPAAEESAVAFLAATGFQRFRRYERATDLTFSLAPGRLGAAVAALVLAGWKVEAEGKLYRRASAFSAGIRSGIDWFELHGGADFDGACVPLPAILAALHRGERMIPLGDGTIGLLPEEWIRRYAPIAGMGEANGDHVRFSRTQALLLDALLAAEPETTCDAAFSRARKKLSDFAGVRPAPVPVGFRGRLRPYQKEGLGWLAFLREFGFGGCLADDMGLGKTIQVLAMLESRRTGRRGAAKKPSLVVAPRSVILNWQQEAARFTPGVRLLDHTGIERSRSTSALRSADLVLTSYGTLSRDIEVLRKIEFDYAILDESQAIKNSATLAAKAVRLLRAEHRLALSGTPIENHVGELFNLFDFLNPGMLGTASSGGAAASRSRRNLDEAARAVLARALRPVILRRTKAQVAPELPARTEQTLTCTLEGLQRRLYDEIRDHYRASLLARVQRDGLAKSKMHILEALLRLRQAACHPALIDPKRGGVGSAKLSLLFSQLDDVVEEGHKALVFSQFTSFLGIVLRSLALRGIPCAYLDGSMNPRDRDAAVRRFQEDPKCPVFLLSLKAGGVGLNLTAAEYVYLLDPWWNPAVEAQAIDRAHRIGQSRSVFAYRLVAEGTIEEKILALQARKRALVESLLGADGSVIRDLTREDLEALLG
ncbi:MAG: DEAD/DEAH box helicase [Acidobacteria bacterium]|nr:DEAD/DEAH box helicase [Acidobacteriota bacterium]